MHIALVSPYPDITNYGLRSLSAVLRRAGHTTRLLLMPDEAPGAGLQRYRRSVLEDFLELVRDADLIGISSMIHYFDTARQLTLAVRERYGDTKRVIWGGFHPSTRPEESIRHADFVAVGDAEELILELVAALEEGREDLSGIASLVWRRGDEVVRNTGCRLEQDLDSYPPPDWSLDDHWVLEGDRVVPLTEDILRRHLHDGSIARLYGRTGYQTMTGRGCPHACAYCGNSYYRSLYRGQRYVRFRSVEHVMDELEAVTQRFPWIDLIWFSDDSFFARSLEDTLEFWRVYRERIGLPFFLLGSPGTITEEKYAAAVDAGLLSIQMGIEHGSPRIQRMFHREAMSNDKVLEAAHILAKYADRTAPPQYDLVFDLDYETLEDRLDTLRLVTQLPKPYRLQIFSILYYPGTALHTLAVADGLLYDERAQVYDRTYYERNDSYTNTLLFMARRGRFPHWLLRALVDRRVVDVLTSDAVAPAAGAARLALRGYRRLSSPRVRERARGVLSSIPGLPV